ncbi:hypothetical protein BVC80_441g61 [Macleaya cordata]|uniref:Uncharacterized protein n=1 Tax=Macleaya cordata TaxID=56857 RepID=A0A200Q4C8_MACCD|nr:hypothetical protein BVC80_441g61 [Macleaya cordata]
MKIKAFLHPPKSIKKSLLHHHPPPSPAPLQLNTPNNCQIWDFVLSRNGNKLMRSSYVNTDRISSLLREIRPNTTPLLRLHSSSSKP